MYFMEEVDAHDCVIWARAGVVDDVQVHELLDFQIRQLELLDDCLEQRRNVPPHSHIRDDFPDGLALYLVVQGIEVFEELAELTFPN